MPDFFAQRTTTTRAKNVQVAQATVCSLEKGIRQSTNKRAARQLIRSLSLLHRDSGSDAKSLDHKDVAAAEGRGGSGCLLTAAPKHGAWPRFTQGPRFSSGCSWPVHS
mmetsp:Transcript_361/g.804  ORF Transcript_361/g.804 Transcript_361/m.804 type:complete len:108 (-) Transcript_361:564-887(-)